MNAKKAKKLRSIAKMIVQKQQETSETNLFETAYQENTNNRKTYTQYKSDSNGKIIFDKNGMPEIERSFPIAAGTISVSNKCVRGVYKNLKKSAR